MDRLRLAALALLVFASPAAAQPAPEAPPPAPTEAAPPPADAPPPPPAAPMKPLPTTGEAAQVLSLLDNACVPLIAKKEVKSVASTAGMRVNGDGDLYMNLDGGRRITIAAPSVANPSVCSMTVRYTAGDDLALSDALDAWTSRRPTPMQPDRVKEQHPEDGGVSITSTWVAADATNAYGLLYILHKKADGSPLGGREEATVQLSIRPN